jgi:hypothetical protein
MVLPLQTISATRTLQHRMNQATVATMFGQDAKCVTCESHNVMLASTHVCVSVSAVIKTTWSRGRTKVSTRHRDSGMLSSRFTFRGWLLIVVVPRSALEVKHIAVVQPIAKFSKSSDT